ncbi:MAG: hypothetical protein NWE93_11905 [Candidatus Bathyarchaeota archaeon]|nr:hypothetical protein [Candidatus Bathyarchaeota archaeon]
MLDILGLPLYRFICLRQQTFAAACLCLAAQQEVMMQSGSIILQMFNENGNNRKASKGIYP